MVFLGYPRVIDLSFCSERRNTVRERDCFLAVPSGREFMVAFSLSKANPKRDIPLSRSTNASAIICGNEMSISG